MDPSREDCPVCESNRGIARISPGPVIYEGTHWIVEHAYPSSLLGWVVIVLRRHVEALRMISVAEAAELGALQRTVGVALHSLLGTEKEYSVCYGEAPRFSHLHFHMVPRAPDLAEPLRGGRVFHHLKSIDPPVADDAVREFCRSMREAMGTEGLLRGDSGTAS